MPIRGGCLCGAVHYEVQGALKGAGNCHCSICRRANGAAFVSWAFVDPAEFHWTAGEDSLASFESSPGQVRLRCSQCGSPLAVSHAGKVGEIVLASVEGDPGVRPDAHIFVGSRAPWHDITDQLPQHASWPPGLGPS